MVERLGLSPTAKVVSLSKTRQLPIVLVNIQELLAPSWPDWKLLTGMLNLIANKPFFQDLEYRYAQLRTLVANLRENLELQIFEIEELEIKMG